jgi:hypothetical protein
MGMQQVSNWSNPRFSIEYELLHASVCGLIVGLDIKYCLRTFFFGFIFKRHSHDHFCTYIDMEQQRFLPILTEFNKHNITDVISPGIFDCSGFVDLILACSLSFPVAQPVQNLPRS